MARMMAELGELDSWINGISELSEEIDNIADEVLDEAIGSVVKAYKDAVAAAASQGYATGAAAGSIEARPAQKNAYGHFAVARPTGADKRGMRNAEKIAYLEYGTPKQAAHPVRTAAAGASEGAATAQITARIEAIVEQYAK